MNNREGASTNALQVNFNRHVNKKSAAFKSLEPLTNPSSIGFQRFATLRGYNIIIVLVILLD